MRELRMYGLVPYNISSIQQSIQFGHAVVEYGLAHFNTESYQDWANNWKTFIILNGGTTNDDINKLGTLNQHLIVFKENNITVECFKEPDLGDQLTAIVFIIDERVFNKELWPDYDEWSGLSIDEWKNSFSEDQNECNKIVFLRDYLKKFRLA